VTWTSPDRTQTRDACRAAIAEYIADGAVDTDPPTFQHHHGAMGRW
jgi:hypothetical protein